MRAPPSGTSSAATRAGRVWRQVPWWPEANNAGIVLRMPLGVKRKTLLAVVVHLPCGFLTSRSTTGHSGGQPGVQCAKTIPPCACAFWRTFQAGVYVGFRSSPVYMLRRRLFAFGGRLQESNKNAQESGCLLHYGVALFHRIAVSKPILARRYTRGGRFRLSGHQNRFRPRR
jgi:hypothetical protein